MKIKNIIQSTAVAALLFAGCSKERLDLEPKGLLLEESFFNTDDDAFRALASCYDAYAWTYAWGMSWWVNLNVASDDANAGGENANDRLEYQQADTYTLTTTQAGSEQLWRKYYAGIYRCNLLFANATLETEATKQYIAEAKFLRANFYFDLVRFFGDVPLITGPIGSADYALARTPKEEVFNQIVLDLQDAIVDLPVSNPKNGRVYKAAGKALLGKVYLFMSSPYFNLGNHYQDAANQFAEVIATGNFSLLPNYAAVFDADTLYNDETILEINYSDMFGLNWDDNNPGANAAYPQMEANIDWQLCGIRGLSPQTYMAAGWGFVKPTAEIAQAYIDENDLVRFNASLISGDTLVANGYNFTDPWGYDGYLRLKYGIFIKDYPANSQAWANNTRVIRLADVYLMLAECMVNGATDNGGKSADYYVNEVRNRVNLSDKTGVTMDDIMTERRLELAFEGIRYWDVLRWNKGDEIFGNHKKDEDRVWDPIKKGLWPLPSTEILRTNGSLVQNPGY